MKTRTIARREFTLWPTEGFLRRLGSLVYRAGLPAGAIALLFGVTQHEPALVAAAVLAAIAFVLLHCWRRRLGLEPPERGAASARYAEPEAEEAETRRPARIDSDDGEPLV